MKEENLIKIDRELKDLFGSKAAYLIEDDELVRLILKQRMKRHGESKSMPEKVYQVFPAYFKEKKGTPVVFSKIEEAFDYLMKYIYRDIKPKPKMWRDAHYNYKHKRSLANEKKLELLEEAGCKMSYVFEKK